MVNVVLITHESLGESLIKCAQHIMGGPIPNLSHLAVSKHDDPDEIVKRAQQLVHSVDTGSGVLLLTDIFGATPSNIATRLIVPGHVAAIAGVNLPMLIRALTYCEQSLEDVIQKALAGGQDGVLAISPPFTES
jgi:PTS system ascorbate-specific IIA component